MKTTPTPLSSPAIPLGKSTEYISQYSPELLFPIARREARAELALEGALPFVGRDHWTAYEISWLDAAGKPQVRLADIRFPCDSEYLVESKSFKLYLNSYNQTVFATEQEVIAQMQRDLSQVTAAEVELRFYPLTDQTLATQAQLPGRLIDQTDIDVKHYHPQPALLQIDKQQRVSQEILYSHLLKTNCPVTGQPDWATLFIEYSGHKIVESSLLAYIISFREHQDFHENCVERLFCEIKQYCSPDALTVYARYTRRGGLDINPLRTNMTMVKVGDGEAGDSGTQATSSLASLSLRVNRQ